jgi:NagD protein
MAALIERASGVSPFFVGKPNPLMTRLALNYLGAHSENTVMIGDRMDTDIVTGIESGMETILVLSGVTREEDVRRFPYQPTRIVKDSGVRIQDSEVRSQGLRATSYFTLHTSELELLDP